MCSCSICGLVLYADEFFFFFFFLNNPAPPKIPPFPHPDPLPTPPRLLRGEHDLVGLAVLVRRFAAEHRPAEVGAVTVDDSTEVEHHRRAVRDRLVRGRALRVEIAPAQAGEDVRPGGRAARAGGGQLT